MTPKTKESNPGTGATKKLRDFPVGSLSNEFRESLRQASLMRFRQHSGSSDTELAEIEGEIPEVFANWMGLVLVAGPSLRLVFKTHFDSRDIRSMGQVAFAGQGETNPSQSTIADFVREYCNLMGGAIKTVFETAGIEVGVSLPLVTKGFDEIFSEKSPSPMNCCDGWTIFCGNSKVICTMELEVIDPEVLNTIAAAAKEIPAIQEEGEIDFL